MSQNVAPLPMLNGTGKGKRAAEASAFRHGERHYNHHHIHTALKMPRLHLPHFRSQTLVFMNWGLDSLLSSTFKELINNSAVTKTNASLFIVCSAK